MGLIHWWPLNGNTKDYGLNTADGTLIGTANVTTAGKIGKCLSAGNGSQITAGVDVPTNLVSELTGKDYTFAVWVKLLGQHVHYNGTIISSGNWNNKCWAFGISQANNQIDVACNGYNRYISYTFTVGQWYHIVSVQKGTTNTVYVNGTLVSSSTQTAIYQSDANNLCIGRETYASGYFSFNGNINDVRVYDHALSVKEIKELSKCLVLHYNFEDEYIEPTTNLVNVSSPSSTCYNGSKSTYGWGSNTDMYKEMGTFQGKYAMKVRMGTAGAAAWPFPWFDNANPYRTDSNNYCTLSFDYYPTSITTLLPYSYRSGVGINSICNGINQNGATISNIKLNQWNHIEITYQRTNNDYPGDGCGYIRIGTSAHTSTTTDYWLFANIQTEYKDHATPYVNGTRSGEKVYDSSGYGNNGTVTGSPQIVSNTGIGLHSCWFDGGSTAVQTPNLADLIHDGYFTLIGWFMHTSDWSSDGYETLYGGPGGFEIEAKHSSTNSPQFSPHNWGGSGSTDYRYVYTLNNWHQWAMVRTPSGTQFYFDGEFRFNGSTAGSIPSGNYFIGAWNTYSQQNYKGYIGDFKIYSTALSATDIKADYNRKAAIDRNGKLFTGEIIENGKSQELLWTAKADWGISYRQSGSADRITVDPDGSVVFTKQVWAKSPMIPVTAGEVLYYDITYSNTSGNLFYLGYEFYNASGGSNQNEGCAYVIATQGGTTRSRIKGTITVPAQAASAATTQLRLRILNDWNGTGNASYIAKIHHISLRRVSSIDNPKIDKNNYVIANDIREYNYINNTSLYKDGFVAANKIEEI